MSKEDSAVIDPPPAPPAPPKQEKKPKSAGPKPKVQPPWAVVVLNDNDHTFAYVIEGLTRFCGHSVEKAFKLAEQIHRTGRAAVWTGSMEVAELKRDQLKGMGPDFYAQHVVTYPLGVFIEPMP
jgi:ATP-dependent Clp protease adaptor protein ClpS